MTTIEVRISKHRMQQLDNHSVHIGNYTMRTLRGAGIPVQGALCVVWVDDGELTVKADGDGLVYEWRGDQPLAKAEATEEEIW